MSGVSTLEFRKEVVRLLESHAELAGVLVKLETRINAQQAAIEAIANMLEAGARTHEALSDGQAHHANLLGRHQKWLEMIAAKFPDA